MFAETFVLRQRHEAHYALSITTVFGALLRVLARRRWAAEAWFDPTQPLPPVGRRYVHRNGTVVRRGRIMECLKPVLLTLYESLFDPPCRVRLRLRWRLEPLDAGTSVLLDARFELNGAAYLNRKHWRTQIDGHCRRILLALEAALSEIDAQGAEPVSGHSSGSSSMTVTNTTAVNGRPSFK
jgi:hypothetical protein